MVGLAEVARKRRYMCDFHTHTFLRMLAQGYRAIGDMDRIGVSNLK